MTVSTNASICRGPASRCDVNVVTAALVERRVPMDAPGCLRLLCILLQTEIAFWAPGICANRDHAAMESAYADSQADPC